MQATTSELCCRCQLKKPLVAQLDVGMICQRCFDFLERSGVPCSECGMPGEWANLHPEDPSLGNICGSCVARLTAEFGTCPQCKGENKRLSQCSDQLGKICGTCYLKNFPQGECARCKLQRPLPSFHPDDDSLLATRRRVCRDCFKALVYGFGRCPGCKNIRELKYLDPRIELNKVQMRSVVRICMGCHDNLTKKGTCPTCSKFRILKHVHPQDVSLDTVSKRHVCRKCFVDLSGYESPTNKGICPICPEDRREKLRELRVVLEIDGVPIRVCRQCSLSKKLLGICSYCTREMMLWKVHPADRILMPDDYQRRVCNTCYSKLNKIIRNVAELIPELQK